MHYKITGADSSGQERIIQIHASNERDAVTLAKEQGIYAMKVVPVSQEDSLPDDQVVARYSPTRPEIAARNNDASIANVFSRYMNSMIGVNYRNPEKYEAVILVAVSEDHFTIQEINDGLLYHFPFRAVLAVVEPQPGDSVSTGAIFSKHYRLVVQVFHMVIYKGAIGVGYEF